MGKLTWVVRCQVSRLIGPNGGNWTVSTSIKKLAGSFEYLSDASNALDAAIAMNPADQEERRRAFANASNTWPEYVMMTDEVIDARKRELQEALDSGFR